MTDPRPADVERLQAALGDRYTVEREVARGGWASVYRARDRKHDRVVAVKVFHPELATTFGPERFLQEIRFVAGFQHPYILPLHDSGETDDSLYYVMPFVEGETLRERLTRLGTLPLDDALAITRDVLGALAYAHDRAVVHRDIKPENILLSGSHALVADFGIARAITAARGERLSRPGIAVGTPAYMAPEQALGEDEVDGRSDVYAVGCMLYEMLAGRPAFPDATLQSVIDRHADEDVARAAPDVAALPAGVPDFVARAIARATALMPDARFRTAADFADALTPPVTPVAPTWPPSIAEARTRRRRRRRLATAALLLIGIVAVAAVGVAWWQVGRETRGVSASRVAVFPFVVHGASEYAYLGPGMVDLLSADLDGAGDIRSVDPRAVLGATGDSGVIAPSKARDVATRLGAGRYVLGSVTEQGGRVRVRAVMYGHDSTSPVADAHAEGDGGRLFDLVDEIAAELLAGERRDPGGRLVRLAAVTTHSLPALKLYLTGEQQLRQGHADSAMRTFGLALEADPQFGLAAYRRAVAADWAANFGVAREAGEKALLLGSRLSPGDQRLLQAFLAWHRGDAARAEALYREILADQPDNVEAWYQLGEVFFHYGATRGRSFTEAREAFERARTLDPQNVSVAFHLLDIAARDGRWSDFDALLRGVRADGAILLRRRAVRAFAVGDAIERSRVLAALAGASDGSVIVAAGGIATYHRDLAAADTVAQLLVAPTRRTEARAYGNLLRAQFAYARGRPTQAARILDEMAPLDSVAALELRAYAGILHWIPIAPAELSALRRRVEAWNGEPIRRAGPAIPPLAVHDSVHAALRAYLAAMLAARAGDTAAAARHAAALATTPVPAMERSLPTDLARGVRASLLWLGGDPRAALAEVERVRTETPMDRLANSSFFSNAHERFMRAELLRTLGRGPEAIGWYESLGEARNDVLFLAPAQLRLGQLYEEQGDFARAAVAYGTAVAAWRDCEPGIRPLRDEATAGLRRLRAR